MATAFFKLTNQFAIEETKGLSAAEIRILLFLKTLNPFGDRKLVLSIPTVAEKLDINPSTVSRAFKKLKGLGKITIEVIRQVSISTPGVDNTSSSTPTDDKSNTGADSQSKVPNGTSPCETETSDAKSNSTVRNCQNQTPNPAPVNKSETPQTNNTYKDFLDSLSDPVREKFFNFVRSKTKSFHPPLVNLSDYLRSKSRYLEFYEEFRSVVPAEEISFRIEELTKKPEWKDILDSIKRSWGAFVAIGGIDEKFNNIPQQVRKQLCDYVRAKEGI